MSLHRKRMKRTPYTYESIEKTCLSELSQEEKDALIHSYSVDLAPDCDETSIDYTNAHRLFDCDGKGNLGDGCDK